MRFWAVSLYREFWKCGENRNLPRELRFFQQNRRSQESKTGVWLADLIFSPHFRINLSIICGSLWNPRAQLLFGIKDPQVEALRHSGALGTLGICRMLPSFGLVPFAPDAANT